MSLAIAALEVAIGPAVIIRGADLQVATGRVCGLIGRNGAGKTTLMRAVMGLLPARAGDIRFDDAVLTGIPAHARTRLGIGYMPEDRRLLPDFTVGDNILLPVWATGARDATTRFDWILELMPELKLLAQRRANQLSGGQQKMVALARALMAGTRLLLLDEPLEGLAPALAQRLAEVLATLRGSGLTVLMAESSFGQMNDLFDDVFIIERGSISPGNATARVAQAGA
jgi:branched-chain amino acid transport system ATP-binding protein